MIQNKKWFAPSLLGLIFVLTLIAVPGAKAETNFNDSYVDRALYKLGRGIHNTLFCWGEIPYRISETNELHGALGAATAGLVRGLGRTVVRAVVGVYEDVTFLVPQKSIVKPEFFFEDF